MIRFQIRDLIWLTLVVALVLGLFASFKYVETVRKSNNDLRTLIKISRSDFLSKNLAKSKKIAALESKLRSAERSETIHEFSYQRGCALIAVERMEEAAAIFEVANLQKPDDMMTIDYLIKCYDEINEKQAEKYRQLRQELIDDLLDGFSSAKRQREAYQRRKQKARG